MPRPPRGGGGNRTDLYGKQAVRTPTGGGYGDAKKLADAQQAVPLPQAPDPQRALQAAAAEAPPPPITAPSANPAEALTTGLASGPGPGPEVLGPGPGLTPLDELRALVRVYPDPALLRLIAYADGRPQ